MNENQAYIRRMTIDDVEAVYRIEVESFKTPWSLDAFDNEIRKNQLAVYFVAVFEEEVIGYAGMWTVVDELHVTNVAVTPSFRGRGISKLLMDALFNYAHQMGFISITLEVRTNNAVAISLYEQYGFKALGVRKGYYQDTNEDALIMWKEF